MQHLLAASFTKHLAELLILFLAQPAAGIKHVQLLAQSLSFAALNHPSAHFIQFHCSTSSFCFRRHPQLQQSQAIFLIHHKGICAILCGHQLGHGILCILRSFCLREPAFIRSIHIDYKAVIIRRFQQIFFVLPPCYVAPC